MIDLAFGFNAEQHPTLEEMHEDALKWVNQQLQRHSLNPVAKLDSVHNTPWSVVAKVQHEKGVWFFKALAKHIAYELDVTTELDQLFPDHSRVVASDSERGFLLLNDLGVNLFDYQPQSECFSLWKAALADYSRMQVKIATCTNNLSAILPNRTLNNAASSAWPIINSCIDIQPREGETPLTHEDIQWLQNYFTHWHEVVSEINSVPLPNSLHHGDLHGANIAMKEKLCVFDWGDSSWSHPFATYFISADALQSHLNIQDSSVLEELEEAYLEPWLEFASMDELKHVLRLVNKVSPLVMFLSWAHAISNRSDQRNKGWESGLITWINEFLKLNRVS